MVTAYSQLQNESKEIRNSEVFFLKKKQAAIKHIPVVIVILSDANIGVNHLMKQSILQIRFIMTFTQGFGKKYNTATTSRIIVTRAYITAVG